MFGDHDHFTLVANLNSFFLHFNLNFPSFLLSNYKQSDHYSFPFLYFTAPAINGPPMNGKSLKSDLLVCATEDNKPRDSNNNNVSRIDP